MFITYCIFRKLIFSLKFDNVPLPPFFGPNMEMKRNILKSLQEIEPGVPSP
jgi:hypothetical protein